MNKEKIYQKLIQIAIDGVTDYIVQQMFELAQQSPYLAIILAAMMVTSTVVFYKLNFRLLLGKVHFMASRYQLANEIRRAIDAYSKSAITISL